MTLREWFQPIQRAWRWDIWGQEPEYTKSHSTVGKRKAAIGKLQDVRRPPVLQISSCSTTYKCRGERKIQLSIYFILKCPQLEHKPNSLFQSNQDPPFSYERWLIIWEKNVVSILVNIFIKYLLVLIRLSWHNITNVQ